MAADMKKPHVSSLADEFHYLLRVGPITRILQWLSSRTIRQLSPRGIGDIFGFRSRNIAEVAKRLEVILEIKWEKRDSSSFGEYYRHPPFGPGYKGEVLRLEENYIEEDWRWQLPKFKSYPVLLKVCESSRNKELYAILNDAFGDEVAPLSQESSAIG